MSLAQVIKAALDKAEADWRAKGGEHDRKPDSVIDRIFKESGWSAVGVPKEPNAKIPEWCGMTVCSWMLAAGMDTDFRSSFYHTYNLEAFFTYGAQRNVNPKRLDTEVKLDTGWKKLRAWHESEGALRTWMDHKNVVSNLGSKELFLPGDVVLIDWSKRADDADHITMVRNWDGRYLKTWEGNRTGLSVDGKRVRDAVVSCTYDLSDPAVLALIYGVGRMSVLDFDEREFR